MEGSSHFSVMLAFRDDAMKISDQSRMFRGFGGLLRNMGGALINQDTAESHAKCSGRNAWMHAGRREGSTSARANFEIAVVT